MPDDSTLQALVMDELEWQPSLNAAHIGVVVKNGIVTLSGFVESFAAKAAAERAAGRVEGVKALATEIEVRLPNAVQHADDEIAERAVRILAWDIEVPRDCVHVKVSHGVVTLAGDVPYHFQRAAAEAAVRRLGGVRAVANQIRVVPASGPAPDTGLVRRKIEMALQRSAEIEASRITIAVDGSKVVLQGQVRSWFERKIAEDAAWAAPGVTEVKDELHVQP